MALIPCPECGNQISEQATACPSCGHPQSGMQKGMMYPWFYEYKSEATMFGLPLVHVVAGPPVDPTTGKIRVAKGIIAIGGIAIGGLAMGGFSFGLIAFGGVAIGLAASGGVALGLLLAMGGLAVGFFAVGGCAIGYYAIGGAAFGAHAIGGNAQDPMLLEWFEWVKSPPG